MVDMGKIGCIYGFLAPAVQHERLALLTTVTEDMAAPAIIGLSNNLEKGKRIPAVIVRPGGYFRDEGADNCVATRNDIDDPRLIGFQPRVAPAAHRQRCARLAPG
jgi:hypothetical protein